MAAHLQQCEPCAALVEGGQPLAQALDTGAEPAGLDAVWAEVDRDVQAERGPIAWLRSRPTPQRLLFAIIGGFAVVLYGATVMGRADFAVYPKARLALDLTVMGAAMAFAIGVALRPLHRPAVSARAEWLGVGLAIAAALVGPLLPEAHQDHPESLAGLGDDFAHRASACFAVGMGLALPLLLWLGVLVRRRGRLGLPPALAVVFSGLVGATAVFLHCPLVGPAHLVTGHSTVVGVFLLLAVVAGFWGRRDDR